MTSKHTPGPWEAWETEDGHEIRMGNAIASPGYYSTENMLEYRHLLTEDDGEQRIRACANARLIAAAPDLLDAAKEFCRRVEAGEIRSKRSYAAFSACVAKAEGRS